MQLVSQRNSFPKLQLQLPVDLVQAHVGPEKQLEEIGLPPHWGDGGQVAERWEKLAKHGSTMGVFGHFPFLGVG